MAIDSAVLDQITGYIEIARIKVKDGVTVSELAELTLGGMRLSIKLLDALEMPGADKKAEVLKLVAYFFDTFSDACVPMLARPAWWIVKPATRALVLSLASGAVEFLLPVVRSVA